jgi:hypothetical protein
MGMKSVSLSLLALALVTTLFGAFSVVPAAAQEASPIMTSEHIARIKENCSQAMAVLVQTHASDAPVYINRNQQYFSISDKLMAHLNSRLTLNRYDATQLVKTASDFNAALSRFRTDYKTYDDDMADLIKVDCNKTPVEFYDRVADARAERGKVHDDVDRLNTLIDQYSGNVSDFSLKHAAQLAGND